MFTAAPAMNVDGVRINVIMPSKETFQSQIKISGTLYKWLNTDKRPCLEGEVHKNYDYCDKFCYWREERSTCLNISGAAMLDEDTVDKVCVNDVHFLSPSQTIRGNSRTNTFNKLSSQNYNSCIAQYCQLPCNQWKYTSTVSSLPVPTEFAFLGFPTTLYVEYPVPSSVLVVTEVTALTWENIVGNIGGITGLWLGASVISIIQMVYLLCCRTCDEKLSAFGRKRPNRNRVNSANWPQYPISNSNSNAPTSSPPRYFYHKYY